MLSLRVLVLAVVATLPATGGCVADHSVLGEQPSRDAGNAGSGGRSTVRDAASEREPEAAPSVVRDTGTPPPGTRSLTFVHGVTDSPWLAFCLSFVQDGKTTAIGAPFPPGGLDYGHSARLDETSVAELATAGLSATLVLADSAAAVKGLDCAGILALAAALSGSPPVPDAGAPPGAMPDAGMGAPHDASLLDASLLDASIMLDASSSDAAGPPHDASVPIAAVRAVALPIVPAGAFADSRGYLLVVGGCAGGPGVTDPSEKSVCGELYSPSTPTLSEFVVASPAKIRDGYVALTVLGGTPALTQVDLGLVPALHGDLVTVATKVVPGALRPLSSYTAATSGELGAKDPSASVELFAFGSDVPIYNEGWAVTLTAGGVTELDDGAAYTLIVIGPFPGFAKRRWWNDPLVTIVENR